MSVEKAVREKHAFRDRLREFLEIAAIMTNDEIEIAMGRLVDLINNLNDEDAILNCRYKGTALKCYFDLRLAGGAKHNRWKRHFTSGDSLANGLARNGPSGPPFVDFWKKTKTASVSDLLVEHIAVFQLVSEGQCISEVTPEEVKRVALSRE